MVFPAFDLWGYLQPSIRAFLGTSPRHRTGEVRSKGQAVLIGDSLFNKNRSRHRVEVLEIMRYLLTYLHRYHKSCAFVGPSFGTPYLLRTFPGFDDG